jgi:hypothetical protein
MIRVEKRRVPLFRRRPGVDMLGAARALALRALLKTPD